MVDLVNFVQSVTKFAVLETVRCQRLVEALLIRIRESGLCLYLASRPIKLDVPLSPQLVGKKLP